MQFAIDLKGIPGTISIYRDGVRLAVRRYLKKTCTARNVVTYWIKLFNLEGKKYELVIRPDEVSDDKTIESYAKVINLKNSNARANAKQPGGIDKVATIQSKA